ncbi:hypothetical protein [Devosia sp. DBB001]|nr:hypothetical protein [Devosia sp. DBB001]
MIIGHVPLAELVGQAAAYRRMIAPAVLDGGLEAVWRDIIAGRYLVFRIATETGAAVLVGAVYEDGSPPAICFGIEYFAAYGAPRRRWLALMRSGIAEIGRLAKEAGCTELRLGGRDWRRVFPDFAPLDGVPHGLRKVL